MKKILLFVINFFLIGSCTDIEDCLADDFRDHVEVSFYDFDNLSVRKSSFVITELNRNDTIFLSSDSLSVSLPLNPTDSSVTFYFEESSHVDTFSLRYDKTVSVFYMDCDPSINFYNIDTLVHSFDSVAVLGNSTSSQITTHFEVYL